LFAANDFASKMTYIVSGGALNSTHSLADNDVIEWAPVSPAQTPMLAMIGCLS